MASGGQRDIELQAHLGRAVNTEMWYFAKSEQAFLVSEEYTVSSSGDTATLTLSNPAASGTTAVFSPIQPSVGVRSYVRVYDTFTSAPSGGSSADVQNVLLDSSNGAPDTGDVTARTGDSFTEDSTHVSELLGGGEGGMAIGGQMEMPVLALEPDRDIVVEIEKLASGPDDMTITARWFEVPQVFSEMNPDPNIDEVYR